MVNKACLSRKSQAHYYNIEYDGIYLKLGLAALTAVIEVATAVYALVTIKLVNETKLLRKAQTDPLISLIKLQSHVCNATPDNIQ